MQALIGRIEAVIHRDVGRGMEQVFQATKGGLWGAVSSVAACDAPKIGLITGFFVPGGYPPAAETDGPAGAALMAAGFVTAGLTCRLATDEKCQSACRVALDAAGATSVVMDTIAPGESVAPLIERWRQQGIDWVIAIERCGPAADETLRNMRGTDISAHTAALHHLFSAGPWRTIGIGDGGNELGMGRISRDLIARHIQFGEAMGCVVPADFLITAGVSHWGAYAMVAALTILRPDWSMALLASLQPERDHAVVEAMVRHGPAVDGVTLRRTSTIDGLHMDAHHKVLQAVRQAASGPRLE